MTRGIRRRATWRAVIAGGLALVAASIGVPGQSAYASGAEKAHVVFTIGSPLITESSSLAMSTIDPTLVYTTNDSGDDGTVYSLDVSTGHVVGQTTLSGVDPLDVEAIAAGIEEVSSRRDELRPLGLERAGTYSWRAVADAVERVWRELA
jgi:hypothetical protein